MCSIYVLLGAVNDEDNENKRGAFSRTVPCVSSSESRREEFDVIYSCLRITVHLDRGVCNFLEIPQLHSFASSFFLLMRASKAVKLGDF